MHHKNPVESRKEFEMKIRKFAMALSLAGALAGMSLSAVAQDDQGAKQDMKDAGHDAKNAAKDTGHATKKAAKKTGKAVKKTTKKAANKTAKKTQEGAEKVQDKTQPQ
jgi:hypothetical protein